MKCYFITACLFLVSCRNHSQTSIHPSSDSTKASLPTKDSGDRSAPEEQAVAKPKKVPYMTYTAEPKDIRFYYRVHGEGIQTLEKLASQQPSLKFATNASMYTENYTPVGLYVEEGKVVNKASIYNNPAVNFGMQPQGVFAITKDGKAKIVDVKKMKVEEYQYAVQCAPLLVIDGKINPQLTKSKSAKTRSGYGLLKDGKVFFVLSNTRVSFQEFAQFFLDKGCTDAVFIDGSVSEFWQPRGEETWGRFAVLVGVY